MFLHVLYFAGKLLHAPQPDLASTAEGVRISSGATGNN